MKKIYFIILLLFYLCTNSLSAQTFKISTEGDTVNLTDANNNKQGQWFIYGNMAKKAGYRAEQIVEYGEYKDNEKSGKWTEYFENGNIRSEVTYLRGEPNGYVRLYYDNGKLKEEGVWQNYHWVGNYKMFYESGKMQYYFHFHKDGKREDGQIYFYEDGSIMIEGEWKDGQENGKVTEYYENGEKKSEKFFNPGGKIDESKSKEFKQTKKKKEKGEWHFPKF